MAASNPSPIYKFVDTVLFLLPFSREAKRIRARVGEVLRNKGKTLAIFCREQNILLFLNKKIKDVVLAKIRTPRFSLVVRSDVLLSPYFGYLDLRV